MITGHEYDTIMDNLLTDEFSSDPGTEDTPRPVNPVRKSRTRRTRNKKITSLPKTDVQLTKTKTGKLTKKPCDSKFQVKFDEINHWIDAIKSIVGKDYDYFDKQIQSGIQISLMNKNSSTKYVSINVYENGTIMVQGLNKCTHFIDKYYHDLRLFVKSSASRETTQNCSGHTEVDDLTSNVNQSSDTNEIAVNESQTTDLNNITAIEQNLNSVDKNHTEEIASADEETYSKQFECTHSPVIDEVTPNRKTSTPASVKRKLLQKANVTKTKTLQSLINASEVNKVLENELLSVQTHISDLENKLAVKIQTSIQPLSEVIKGLVTKVDTILQHQKTQKVKYVEVSTQTEVNKVCEKTQSDISAFSSHDLVTNADRQEQIDNTTPLKVTEHSTPISEYSVSTKNRYSLLSTETVPKDVIPQMGGKEQSNRDDGTQHEKDKQPKARILPNKFERLIIGSSVTKNIDSRYLNYEGNPYTCVRTLSGAHFNHIKNFIKDTATNSGVTHVTIVAGSNDCCSQKSVNEIKNSIDELSNVVRSKFPRAEILFVEPILRRGALGDRFNMKIKEIGGYLSELSNLEEIQVVAINNQLNCKKEFYDGSSHINLAGTAILMKRIKQFWNYSCGLTESSKINIEHRRYEQVHYKNENRNNKKNTVTNSNYRDNYSTGIRARRYDHKIRNCDNTETDRFQQRYPNRRYSNDHFNYASQQQNISRRNDDFNRSLEQQNPRGNNDWSNHQYITKYDTNYSPRNELRNESNYEHQYRWPYHESYVEPYETESWYPEYRS